MQRAINNYDDFEIDPVVQAQGWCNYQLTEDFDDEFDCGSNDDEDISSDLVSMAAVSALIAAIVSVVTLGYVCLKFNAKPAKRDMKENLM